MSVIELPRRTAARNALTGIRAHGWEITWAAVVLGLLAMMIVAPEWQTIPFYLIWISLGLLYGLRVWSMRATVIVLLLVTAASGVALTIDAITQHQDWKMLFKVPLMAMLFLVMVWYARARVDALRASELQARELQAALDRQERFIHDASHELKTPLTIARGHLELEHDADDYATSIALDELRRIDRILGQLLLLATAGQPSFLRVEPIELEPFLEEIFIRWSDRPPAAGTLA